MSTVNVEIPRLGVAFQGVASLPLVGSWLDEEGTPLAADLPVVEPLRTDESIGVTLRITNPNDVDAIIQTITWAPSTHIESVQIAETLPVTIVANGFYDLGVTLNFAGTQGVESTYLEASATAETQVA